MRREDIIQRYVAGRDVLDIGGIDHGFMNLKLDRGDWLHSAIARSARSCLGLDILEDHVKLARECGYQFVAGNAEAMEFDGTFDVVVAGELVEHVHNMGLVLDGAWKALRPSGHLVITTPNNFSFSKMLYAALAGREVCHAEHTCWYSPQTLSYVVSHHGFQPVETHVLGRESQYRPVTWLYDALSRWRPILAETLVLVAVRTERQEKYADKW